MGLSAQSFVFFISSPLHDSLEPGSCCTSHSAGMADASPSPETSPSQLPRHNKTLLRFILPSARLYITNLPETEQPTKVDPLITLGAHVCLPRKGGDASSWKEKTEIQTDTQTSFCAVLLFLLHTEYPVKNVFDYGLWAAAVGKAGLTGLRNSPEGLSLCEHSLSNSFCTFRRRSAGCWEPLLFRFGCRVHSNRGWVFVYGCLIHIRACTTNVNTCTSTQMKTQ